MDFYEFKTELLQRLRDDSSINGTDTEDEFIEYAVGLLNDFDEVPTVTRFGFGDKKGAGRGAARRIMRADGFCFDETDRSLILFISDFQDSLEPSKLTLSRVDELYWRLYNFLDESCNGQIEEYFDDHDEVIKIARLIRNRTKCLANDAEGILKIKFVVLTNKDLDSAVMETSLIDVTERKKKGTSKTTKTTKKIKKADFLEKPLEMSLWYLERFYEMEMTNNNEPIVIDLKRDYPNMVANGIPCIKGNIGNDLGYEAYIAIITGKLLASIYIDHGSKVLEGNVRAFLGTNGNKSVNSGIKRTINNEPSKFFTYNNGIATTAAEVEIEEINGEMFITKITDLQIINGGQTTASLAEAVLKKTNLDLSGIFVPMKLTVIEDRETENEEGVRFYDKMVQDIAKYANSQNRVTAADLFSNDPFHIWMERASKKWLAQSANYGISSGWYYERSRKKYQQELLKLRGMEIKKFEQKFPKKQIVTKEQLAMYLTSVDCKPHIVSKGKNWVMKEFGEQIGSKFRKEKEKFNEAFFQKCICAAIIFRTVDEYLESNKDSARRPTGFWYKAGGYKLNIVPYTIAKIFSQIPPQFSINWEMIWRKQALTPAFHREIEIVTKQTNEFICNSHGIIVTEYCKKSDTWEAYKSANGYKPSKEFLQELVPLSIIKEWEVGAKKEQSSYNDLEVISGIIGLGDDYWNGLFKLGIEKNMLTYQEQTVLSQVIQACKTGNIPTSGNGKVPAKTMSIYNTVLTIKEKLESEGIFVTNGA